ncbi:MAG: hypothetical protein C5B51_28110 [Terriglobia bacterium]|nr:MAG: hypothetical protein C5B51_28110 [Terriglobia bacterium]
MINSVRLGRIVSAAGAPWTVFADSVASTFVVADAAQRVALTVAFLKNAQVTLEVFDNTNVVKRVEAFDVSTHPTVGQISRIATQKSPVSGESFLELFVAQENGQERQLKVVDEAVQIVCEIAAISGRSLKLVDDNGTVFAAEVAAVPAAAPGSAAPRSPHS